MDQLVVKSDKFLWIQNIEATDRSGQGVMQLIGKQDPSVTDSDGSGV